MDKSMMKKAFKEAKRPMGVYRITTTQNDKVYIGFGTDLSAKINKHKFELKLGTHRNRELQETWNLYGESAFDFEVLDMLDQQENQEANPAEELPVLIEMWVDKLEKEGCSVVNL